MLKETNNNIYSGPNNILLDRLDKDLRQFLENKADRIDRAGRDILIELKLKDLGSALAALKQNPDLSFGILKNIKVIWVDKKPCLFCELAAEYTDNEVLLKIKLPGEGSYDDAAEKIGEYYRTRGHLSWIDDAEDKEFDLVIPGTMLAGFGIGLNLEGDTISDALIDREPARVLKRDFFKGMEIGQTISYMGRFDYDAGIFGELAYCRGLESLLQLEIPQRAQYLRIIASELFRITSHLNYIARIAEILGHDIAANMAMIQREMLLGIIEVMTGARVLPNFIRIGGVSSRVGSDIIKNIKRRTTKFIKDFKRIENNLAANFALADRLKDLGRIDRNLAESSGLTGPNLRASGPRYDLRREQSRQIYSDMHFTVPYARGGACIDRLNVRIEEIYQSVKIIRQAAEKIPTGPVLKRINLAHLDLKNSPFAFSVECPHGILRVFGEVEGNSLSSLAVLGPSGPALSVAEEILKGNAVDDVEVILASLDISGGEVLEYV